MLSHWIRTRNLSRRAALDRAENGRYFSFEEEFSELVSKTNISLRTMFSSFLSGFNQKSNFSGDFRKILKYQISQNSVFRARSPFGERAPKTCTSVTSSATKPARNALGSNPFRCGGRTVRYGRRHVRPIWLIVKRL